MKTEQFNTSAKETYLAPAVESETITVEVGFAGSATDLEGENELGDDL
jgi:hypothetical protein